MIKLLSRKPTALRLVNPSAAKIKIYRFGVITSHSIFYHEVMIESRVVGRLRDRKSGSAGMPRPKSYAVFCLKKKKRRRQCEDRDAQGLEPDAAPAHRGFTAATGRCGAG